MILPVSLRRLRPCRFSRWYFCLALVGGCAGSSSEGEVSDRLVPSEPTAAVACDPEAVGQEEGEVTTVYAVVDGSLGPLCHGVSDPVVEASWEELAMVASVDLLTDVELFAGYEAASDTMAFAGPIDEDHRQFVVAVDVVSAADDVDELRLTMVHELAHVLTQTPDQLDTELLPEECETLWNGLGCFRPDSYMAGWMDRFWSDEDLASLPIDGGIDEDGGEDRCLLDPRYVGAYAASHPEEDFADTLSAWVFSVDVNVEVMEKFDYFATFPELVEMREYAIDAGLVDLPSNFDLCG